MNKIPAIPKPARICTCPESQWIGSEPNDSTCELSEEEHDTVASHEALREVTANYNTLLDEVVRLGAELTAAKESLEFWRKLETGAEVARLRGLLNDSIDRESVTHKRLMSCMKEHNQRLREIPDHKFDDSDGIGECAVRVTLPGNGWYRCGRPKEYHK